MGSRDARFLAPGPVLVRSCKRVPRKTWKYCSEDGAVFNIESRSVQGAPTSIGRGSFIVVWGPDVWAFKELREPNPEGTAWTPCVMKRKDKKDRGCYFTLEALRVFWEETKLASFSGTTVLSEEELVREWKVMGKSDTSPVYADSERRTSSPTQRLLEGARNLKADVSERVRGFVGRKQ